MAIVRDIALDQNGDWSLSGQDLAMIADLPAIQQACSIHLKFFKGEWFLDLLAGVPYWTDVLIKAPDVSVLNNVFSTAILEVQGVVSLTSLNLPFDRATRKLSVNYRAVTDAGLLQSTQVLNG